MWLEQLRQSGLVFERFQEVDRAICPRVRQPLIPILQRLADGFARGREFSNLLIDGGEDSLSRRADITTRHTAGRADAQEPTNVS
ncbi:MAG TPA: hypothetical protein VMM15_26420 [Bradyrhizobium sp.]|nr:hypothetical protein [Bradyrhizobium sp.]